MRIVGVFVAMSGGLLLGACSNLLPQPDYVSVKTPPAYRTAVDGSRVDNENYYLDAQGYRLDKKGERIGEVDVPPGVTSNPMAGYYISRLGGSAPGRIATPSEGARAGAGFGPGSGQPMPGNPVPLTPMPATPPK